MWCVVADNNDEFWVYGPFDDLSLAQDFVVKMDKENSDMGITYTVGHFFAPAEAEK